MFSKIRNLFNAVDNNEAPKRFEIWTKRRVRHVLIVQELTEKLGEVEAYSLADANIIAKKKGGYAVPVID